MMRISHTERIVHITKKCVHTYSYVYTRRQVEIRTSRLCAVEELMHTCTYTYIHLTHVTTYIYICIHTWKYIYRERENQQQLGMGQDSRRQLRAQAPDTETLGCRRWRHRHMLVNGVSKQGHLLHRCCFCGYDILHL